MRATKLGGGDTLLLLESNHFLLVPSYRPLRAVLDDIATSLHAGLPSSGHTAGRISKAGHNVQSSKLSNLDQSG